MNEGSSTPAYTTYEFFLKRPPSMLGALLGSEEFPNDKPLIPPTVRSLSYIAIFPLSSHFRTLTDHLPYHLQRLYVQLVPRNDLLDHAPEMRHLEPRDLWMERNSCYALVMREMLSTEPDETGVPGWQGWWNLREFASGDAADRDSWEEAVRWVQMVDVGWKVAGDGVFAREKPNQNQDRERVDSSADEADHYTLSDDQSSDHVDDSNEHIDTSSIPLGGGDTDPFPTPTTTAATTSTTSTPRAPESPFL